MEPSYVISIVSVLFAIFSWIYATMRNKKSEGSNEAQQMTTVIVKLENIGTGISELKAEVAGVKADRQADHDQIIKMDQSLKSAWKQIDELNDTCGRKRRPPSQSDQ